MNTLLNDARRRVALAACVLALAACGDDDDTNPGDGPVLDGSVDASIGLDSAIPTPGDSGTDAGPTTPPRPEPKQFVFSTAITVGGAQTGYVQATNDIDSNVKVDIKKTVEAPGYGDLWVRGDKAYVTDETAILRKYTVNADGSFTPAGTVNFGTYASGFAPAGIYKQVFVNDTKALLKGDSAWVIWNPSTLSIDGTIPFPASITGKRSGFDTFFAYDRGFVVRGNRLYQAINWADYAAYKFDPSSAIVVIDLDDNTVASVLDSTCPGLDTITEDDAGNLWVSGWVWGPAAKIVNNQPAGCIEKIPAGSETIDAAGRLTWASITGGREGAAFRHVRGNTFLFTVFRDDTTPAFNPATQTIGEYGQGANWQYATYDLVTKQYKVLENLPKNSGGYYYSKLGSKFYLLTPGNGYATTSYQQLLADDSVKDGIYMDGWSTRLFGIVR